MTKHGIRYLTQASKYYRGLTLWLQNRSVQSEGEFCPFFVTLPWLGRKIMSVCYSQKETKSDLILSASSPRAWGKHGSLPCCPLQQLLQDVGRVMPSVRETSGQLKAPPLLSLLQAQDLSRVVPRAGTPTGALPVQFSVLHSQLPGSRLLPRSLAERLAAPSHHTLGVHSCSHAFLLLFSLKYFYAYYKLPILSLWV